ncbi:MAG: isocitrate/isopropylmalate family dehydrogenase [Bacteroidia bacterium]
MSQNYQNRTIAVAPGDGIGPEIMNAVLEIFRAAEVPLNYQFVEMGKDWYLQGHSSGMTPEARSVVESLGVLFKGPMETPKGKGMKSINVTARKTWNTYANKRIFKTIPGVETIYSKAGIPIDLTIVRENIEDTYGGIEHMLTHDVALCRRFITRPGSMQVHRYAFEMALRKGARKVTCAHKANIMKLTDGLFLEAFYEVAKDYPQLQANDVIVDDMAMKLVMRPYDYDVIILPNLQGDIISDLCAGLVGGLGFAPSANIGDYVSIFEAVHGTAPDITGQNKANPTALLISGLMMLRHLGLETPARRIENALYYSLENGVHTSDFGVPGQGLTTTAFAAAIIANLGKQPKQPVKEQSISKEMTGRALPVENRMLVTKNKPVQELMGADFFVESELQPAELAQSLSHHLGETFKLVTISNRGTQVWPTGSVLTDLINQYRVRIEKEGDGELSQTDLFSLTQKIAESCTICSLEMLLNFDGQPAYSKAQGQ